MLAQSLSAGDAIYSPWFPRQAANVVFRVEQVQSHGTGALTATFYHKNAEDTGDGSTISGTAMSFTNGTNEIKSQVETEVKELIRIRLAASSGGAVVARVLQPVFYDANRT